MAESLNILYEDNHCLALNKPAGWPTTHFQGNEETVDRLAKAGLVRRERDESDRRKVFIAPVPENIAKVGKFYEQMQRAILKDWESYSDAELRLLLRFMTQGYETMRAATEALRAMMDNSKAKRSSAKKPAREP